MKSPHPRLPLALLLLCFGLVACGRPSAKPPVAYQTMPVERRDIRVAVKAAGQIEPS